MTPSQGLRRHASSRQEHTPSNWLFFFDDVPGAAASMGLALGKTLPIESVREFSANSANQSIALPPVQFGLAQRVQRSPLLPVNLPCMQSCCAILSHNFAHLPYALAMLPVRLALLSVESAWLASCVAHQNAALAVLPYGFAIMNDATVDVPLPMTKLTFSLAAVSPNLFDLAWSTASQCAAFSSPTT